MLTIIIWLLFGNICSTKYQTGGKLINGQITNHSQHPEVDGLMDKEWIKDS
jgi:hypothetical protein